MNSQAMRRAVVCSVLSALVFVFTAAAAAAQQPSVAVSWLEWQLRHDLQGAGRFVGENGGLCRDAHWSLQRKQFPAGAVGH